jgi:hypothetical protein
MRGQNRTTRPTSNLAQVIRPAAWPKEPVLQPGVLRIPFEALLDQFEAAMLQTALACTDGTVEAMAECLQITPDSLGFVLRERQPEIYELVGSRNF